MKDLELIYGSSGYRWEQKEPTALPAEQSSVTQQIVGT